MPAGTWAVVHHRYDEEIVPGQRLGRQRRTDSRSAAYPWTGPTQPIVSKAWPRSIPILDQARLGSCEGNAQTGILASEPFVGALPKGHPPLDERLAVNIYDLATSLDGYPGQHPPTDTGTDSTAANQATLQLGFISGYLHAATVDDVLQALMAGPVNLAFDWWSTFDTPDASGLIRIGSAARLRGGHALCCREVDAGREWVWLDNSWTLKWGAAGRCALEWATLDKLLQDGGECVAPVPLTAPAPEPLPVPPDPLAAYLTDNRLEVWAEARHYGANAYAAARWLWLRDQEAARSPGGG